jgi:S-methylmethionine-dependent homocysteine/selenocysteine methylase
MPGYRDRLPQLAGGLFLTDGGIETSLIFGEGFELPYFAAFHLLQEARGADALRRYFVRHATIAAKSGVGFILESATWRASADWGTRLGYASAALADANRKAIELLHDVRRELETPASPMVISGCVGPRGDGYRVDTVMDPDTARTYHAGQMQVLADAGADLATAITMTNSAEAIGVTRAARAAGLPVVVSFTVETDGRLPSGERLASAIDAVDHATDGAPAYFMINCAHPVHFANELANGGAWVRRIRGLRANASTRSHAELDAASDLDAGDPVDLGARYRDIRSRYPHINVLGGCCGTDERHIAQICEQCLLAV